MAVEQTPLIAAETITRSYPGVVALDDVSLDIVGGAVHVIAGENGAGKSTLVKILTGTERPSSGTVRINGDVAGPESDLFRRIAYVPQEVSVFANMSVAENLLLPLSRVGMETAFLPVGRMKARARELLEQFRIPAHPGDRARDLPVSDQQMLMIARACA